MTDEAAQDVNVEDILGEYIAPTHRVEVLVRSDLQQRLDDLEAQLKRARRSSTMDNAGATYIARQIAEVQEQAKSFVHDFVFQSIGNKAWSDLLADHPPKKRDRDAGLDYNSDTFPPAAVAASCVQPSGMTAKTAQRIMEQWSVGQWNTLWTGVLAANGKVTGAPFSAAASALLHDSEQNSTTAQPEASHTASS